MHSRWPLATCLFSKRSKSKQSTVINRNVFFFIDWVSIKIDYRRLISIDFPHRFHRLITPGQYQLNSSWEITASKVLRDSCIFLQIISIQIHLIKRRKSNNMSELKINQTHSISVQVSKIAPSHIASIRHFVY